MRVIVVGAGRLGSEMADALSASGRNEVTVIESDRLLADRLKGTSKARVLHGDAADPTVLEVAGALKAEVLVAVTGEDQVNLVVSLLAKRHFDVPKVVARVNDSDNHWLFTDHWGVDVAVSASATLLSLIQEATSVADTVGLLRLGRAGVGLIETTLTEQSSAVGKSLSDLHLPGGAIVAAILRGGEPTVPGGSFVMENGDEILVISESATEDDIRKVFQH
jgi:trk system potassium uptake protein TrkA